MGHGCLPGFLPGFFPGFLGEGFFPGFLGAGFLMAAAESDEAAEIVDPGF